MIRCCKRTECETSWLTQTLFAPRSRRATPFWREANGSFYAERLVKHIPEELRAVRAHYAVGGRLQSFRKRSL